MNEILSIQQKKLAIPRRFDAVIKEIWAMQPRFEARVGRKPFRLLTHPRFRAAYDFLLLRCESGEIDQNIGIWWKDFQNASSEKREGMLLTNITPKKRRRSRSRKKTANPNIDNAEPNSTESEK